MHTYTYKFLRQVAVTILSYFLSWVAVRYFPYSSKPRFYSKLSGCLAIIACLECLSESYNSRSLYTYIYVSVERVGFPLSDFHVSVLHNLSFMSMYAETL